VSQAVYLESGMRTWIFFVIIILILVPPPGVTGREKGKMEQEISLPSEAAGWRWDRKDLNYNRRTIFDYIDGAGELYLAYNFQGVRVRRFEKPGQPPTIAELFDMGSSEDAYGVFSFERQDEEVGIGQGSEFGGGLLRFWKGRFFVSVYAEGESAEVKSAILSLGRAVADSIQMMGPPPKLINVLPDGKTGLIEKSIRYLHSHILLNQRFFVANQNILNMNQKTKAVLAQYLRDQKKVHLLLLLYPAEKEAESAVQKFRNAYMPEAADEGMLQTEDRKWTVVRQRKNLILIVFGALSKADAEALIWAAEEKIGNG
jgi:hypothetical protein